MIELRWQSTPQLWMAIDAETYDGAPDSKQDICGLGKTKYDAIADLLEQFEERAA